MPLPVPHSRTKLQTGGVRDEEKRSRNSSENISQPNFALIVVGAKVMISRIQCAIKSFRTLARGGGKFFIEPSLGERGTMNAMMKLIWLQIKFDTFIGNISGNKNFGNIMEDFII